MMMMMMMMMMFTSINYRGVIQMYSPYELKRKTESQKEINNDNKVEQKKDENSIPYSLLRSLQHIS
jgi:predicted phage tail protein